MTPQNPAFGIWRRVGGGCSGLDDSPTESPHPDLPPSQKAEMEEGACFGFVKNRQEKDETYASSKSRFLDLAQAWWGLACVKANMSALNIFLNG